MLIELSSHYYRPTFSAGQYRALISDFVTDLGGYDLAAIKTAVEEYRRDPENKFFPHPGALIGLIKTSPNKLPLRHAREPFDKATFDNWPPPGQEPKRTRQQILDEARARRT